MRATMSRSTWIFGFAILGMLCIGACGRSLYAQARSYPNAAYYTSFAPFSDGDYATAADAFQSAGRSAIRLVDGRWIDSICYHTMVGESMYRMGEHRQALTHYSSALQLFILHRGWMLRIDFPQAIGPMQRQIRPPISWGVSRRTPNPGNFPSRMLSIQQGLAVPAGDAVILGQSESIPVDAVEIARCTALAMYRRMEIMGPTCPYDPLTGQLLDVLSRRPAPPNHWSQAWVDTMLGIANASAGKATQAVSDLNRSLKVGQFDHPLTPLGLLTLGRIAFQQGKFNEAINFYYEATFPAAAYGQHMAIGDAMSAAALAYMVSGQRGAYAPLSSASAWARTNSRALQGRLELTAASNLAFSGATPQASALLEQSRATLRRSEMINGLAGARMSYLTALTNFQRGNLTAGQRAFQAAMAFQRKSSLRLFQTDFADRLFTSNQISDRVAAQLYEFYLSDPGSAQWAVDPMETLSAVLTPHSLAMEHWFEVALRRKENEKALEIADLIRRRRFYSSLPMGGRLLSLRWVLEGPEGALTDRAILERRDILTRYPGYAELSRRAADVRRGLSGRALFTDDEMQQDETNTMIASLADTSVKREVMLQPMALQRDAAEFAFPPQLNFKGLQSRMPERRLVLSFFTTNRYVYAFLLDKQNYRIWRIESPDKVRAGLKDLLKKIGLHDKNQPVQLKDLQESSWRETAEELTRNLLSAGNSGVILTSEVLGRYDELVIVPDGVLWYLPFELLQAPDAEGTADFRSRVRIRYAPTTALTEPDRRRLPPTARTAIVAGKMLPRDEDATVEEALADYQLALPGALAIPDRLEAPAALLASQIEQLVVAKDVDDSDRAPYGWSPLSAQRSAGGTVADWMALPFGAPQQLAVPGFHTAAESSLKRGGAGVEVFFTLCGLMSSGTRTVMLSRWRVGGLSSRNLMREFVQELPHQTAAAAWERSLRLHMASPLDPSQEPRVQGAEVSEGLPSEHPFFWAGYLLVDTGVDPTAPPPPRPVAPAPDAAKPGEARPGEAKPDAAKPADGKPPEAAPAAPRPGIPERRPSAAPSPAAPRPGAAPDATPQPSPPARRSASPGGVR